MGTVMKQRSTALATVPASTGLAHLADLDARSNDLQQELDGLYQKGLAAAAAGDDAGLLAVNRRRIEIPIEIEAITRQTNDLALTNLEAEHAAMSADQTRLDAEAKTAKADSIAAMKRAQTAVHQVDVNKRKIASARIRIDQLRGQQAADRGALAKRVSNPDGFAA